MSSEEEDYSYNDVVPEGTDEGVKKAIKESIQELMHGEIKPPTKSRNKRDQQHFRIIDHIHPHKPLPKVEEEEDNYEDIEPYKRHRDYKLIQPPRFKILGYNKLRKPIFQMTDLYLINDLKVQNIIQEQFYRSIYGSRQLPYNFSSRFDNTSQLKEIVSKWENKEDEDFQEDKNNLMSEEQLEDAVVNLGDTKQDYFLYLSKQPQIYKPKQIKNIPLSHPNFKRNLHAAVNRLTQQYRNIVEVEKQQQEDVKDVEDKIQQEKPLQKKYFGEIKNKATFKNRMIKQSEFVVQETVDKNIQGCLNEEIIRHFGQINSCIALEDGHKKSLEHYNRIEIDLNNSNYFLDKLNTVLDKKEYKKLKVLSEQKNITDQNISINNPLPNASVISGSMITGNKQVLSLKYSAGLENVNEVGEDQNQTLEQKISKELKSQQKDVINHSEVAKNFQVTKFSVRHHDFSPFHRYSFPYAIHFNRKIKVIFTKHKPLKNKGTELSLNSQLIASWKKFNKPETLSVSNGQYILTQYIEENPLLLSNVGMCQRMLLQVSYGDILQKVKQDIFNQCDLDLIEERRDNLQKNQSQNVSFQEKCQLWRKNIREIFGENGKVYMWDNKKEGKLIGSPEGAGVAIMQSNLAEIPIVRKQNKKTDFLLVREGDKWFIRKIDNLYVSGQVQPKKTVLNPDSRQFYANFMNAYQKAFILRSINFYGKVRYQDLKNTFIHSNQNAIKKVLKSLNAQANDNKIYTISNETKPKQFELTAQDVCLYQKMQSSICQLQQIGIRRVRHTEKMRQILNIFFKRHSDNLQKFAVSKMIKQQLQLTSWYLTESFAAFINGSAKIDLHGHADPTNHRGGYSYIKKPQKQRTQKEQLQQKQQKAKVSGTNSDLRKLKTQNTSNLLLQRGYKTQQLKGKSRWQLVALIRQEEGTEYARQQRQTKLMKIQNQKKQINKIFNRMLRILNDEEQSHAFQYNFKKFVTLETYMQREKSNFNRKRQILNSGEINEDEKYQEQEDD